MAQIDDGDLLYFPSHWWHEVHNLTPDTLGVTNACRWPEIEPKEEAKEEEDKPKLITIRFKGKRLRVDPAEILTQAAFNKRVGFLGALALPNSQETNLSLASDNMAREVVNLADLRERVGH